MHPQLPHKVFGASLILAPLFNLIATILSGGGNAATAVSLYAIAYAFYIPALLAVVVLLYRAQPSLAVSGGFLAAGGVIASAFWSMLPFAAPGAAAQLVVPLYVMGLMYPLALLMLSMGLWRHEATPRWVGVTLAVSALVFAVSWFIVSPILPLIYGALLLAALGRLGAQFWNGSIVADTAVTAAA